LSIDDCRLKKALWRIAIRCGSRRISAIIVWLKMAGIGDCRLPIVDCRLTIEKSAVANCYSLSIDNRQSTIGNQRSAMLRAEPVRYIVPFSRKVAAATASRFSAGSTKNAQAPSMLLHFQFAG
jgi:hypothetical protein